MKKYLLLLIVSVSFLLLSAYSYVKAVSNNLADSVFRLHVIANSDRVEGQNLKYKVRILMKSKNQELMIQVLHQIVEQFKKELTSKKCSLLIDINTYKLL